MNTDDKDISQRKTSISGTVAQDAHPSTSEIAVPEPSVPRQLAITRDTGTDNATQRISMATIEPDPAGCPHCDDFPDWPAHHCGRPACRDVQAVVWAQQTGRDPAEVLASLDAPQRAAGGLCGGCTRADACTVGLAVLDAVDALGASVDTCRGYAPQQ